MSNSFATGSNYNTSDSAFYKQFENAEGLATNEIAYDVLGHWAFHNIKTVFPEASTLYVADVGSRWKLGTMGGL